MKIKCIPTLITSPVIYFLAYTHGHNHLVSAFLTVVIVVILSNLDL